MARKSHMISMRITEKQWNYLNEMSIRIKKETGFRITRASIILKMMEFGMPFLEKEFPRPETKEKKSA